MHDSRPGNNPDIGFKSGSGHNCKHQLIPGSDWYQVSILTNEIGGFLQLGVDWDHSLSGSRVLNSHNQQQREKPVS
jgi:hypothetical protein